MIVFLLLLLLCDRCVVDDFFFDVVMRGQPGSRRYTAYASLHMARISNIGFSVVRANSSNCISSSSSRINSSGSGDGDSR